MSETRINALPKIMWQGHKSDMDEIYHLLGDNVVQLAANPEMTQLAVIKINEDGTSEAPVILNLGDSLVYDPDEFWVPENEKVDRFGILRGPKH